MEVKENINKSTSTYICPYSTKPKLILKQTLDRHEDKVWCLAWHPTEDLMASSGSDKKIIIWSLHFESDSDKNIRPIAELDESHSRTIRSLAWDYSGNYLASGSFDSTINIWKRKTLNNKIEFEINLNL